MDNSVDRKNAIRLYLTGTIGQITVIAVIVYLLRRMGIVVDYTTVIGMIAIGIGGISSAMWGSIVTVRYRKINFKRIVIEFVNIKQPVFGYLLVFMFLSIEFCYLLMGGMLQVKNWYIAVQTILKYNSLSMQVWSGMVLTLPSFSREQANVLSGVRKVHGGFRCVPFI